LKTTEKQCLINDRAKQKQQQQHTHMKQKTKNKQKNPTHQITIQSEPSNSAIDIITLTIVTMVY